MATLNLKKRLHHLTGAYAEFAIVPAARLVPLGLHASFAHYARSFAQRMVALGTG